MINCVGRSKIPAFSLREVGSRLQSFLAMDCLRRPVDSAGRYLASKTICALSCNNEADESSYGALSSIPRIRQTDFTARDTLIATAGMCSQILFYGALYSAVCSTVGPVEGWHSAAVLLGPWWSSSYWMDWLLYDFIRSSVSLEDVSNGPMKSGVEFLNKWFPHNHHAEFREAAKDHKMCLCLCALVLIATYSFVCMHRPAANQVIMNRAATVAKTVLSSLPEVDLSHSFQDGFYF